AARARRGAGGGGVEERAGRERERGRTGESHRSCVGERQNDFAYKVTRFPVALEGISFSFRLLPLGSAARGRMSLYAKSFCVARSGSRLARSDGAVGGAQDYHFVAQWDRLADAAAEAAQ